MDTGGTVAEENWLVMIWHGNHSWWMMELGRLESVRGNHTEAMKWIEEAQRIYDGPAWQPLLYLGRTACSAGDLSAALDYFDKGLDLSTGNWELLYGKGMCVYQRIGNVGAAQRYLEQAAATDQGQPGIQSVSLQLGGLYEQLGRIQPAIDAYRRVLELDPENATAKQKLSVLEQR